MQDFELTVEATENFYLLNRMLNILSRNRIMVKNVHSSLQPDDCCTTNSFTIHTHPETAEKISKQMYRLVEVADVQLKIKN